MNSPKESTLNRRDLVAAAGAAAVVLGAPAILKGAPMIELPPLPYPDNGLAPDISSNTLSFHYGKHHKAYVDNTNKLIAGTELADLPLEKIVQAVAGKPDKAGIFNNAAQVWNHSFYWKSMRPKGGGAPSGKLKEKIEADLGGLENFKKEFANAGATQFGSGWAWLVLDGGKLKCVKTPNAETPLTTAARPLLTMDVWEHAYYLDWQNRRPDYITAFLERLINWEFAAENLTKA